MYKAYRGGLLIKGCGGQDFSDSTRVFS